MKTSYFAKFSRLSDEEKEGYYPIAISSTVPKWFDLSKGEHIADISPLRENVHKLKGGYITEIEFTIDYISFLNTWIDVDGFISYCSNIQKREDKEIVFLCYEKSDDFCHRHLLRYYLNNAHCLDIEELE